MISAEDEDMLVTVAGLRDGVDDEAMCKFLTGLHARLWELLDEKYGEPITPPVALEPVDLVDFDKRHTWGRA